MSEEFFVKGCFAFDSHGTLSRLVCTLPTCFFGAISVASSPLRTRGTRGLTHRGDIGYLMILSTSTSCATDSRVLRKLVFVQNNSRGSLPPNSLSLACSHVYDVDAGRRSSVVLHMMWIWFATICRTRNVLHMPLHCRARFGNWMWHRCRVRFKCGSK